MTVTVDDTNLKAIADAIREKNGKTTTYTTDEMAAAIAALVTAIDVKTDDLSAYLISNKSLIGSVTLPDSITTILDEAFENCTNLTMQSLPDGITKIGGMAFMNCYKLALSSLPSALTSIGSSAFYYCATTISELPVGVTSVQLRTFYCNDMDHFTFHSGVTKILNYAFELCSNLTTVTFEGTPESISSTAFDRCNKLTTINVPWAEGAVANAPWGATNATINYNYTG